MRPRAATRVQGALRSLYNEFCFLYARLFARRAFYWLNKAMFNFSLRGLGVMNLEVVNGRRCDTGEKWLLRRLLLPLGPGKVVFDVGANVGDYSRMVLSIDPTARIFAFEPHPRSYEKLAAVAGISAVNCAVGAKTGDARLFDYAGAENGSPHASLLEGVFSGLHKAGGRIATHNVKSVALDEFCGQEKIDGVFLLKIDVEGAELDVLKGAQRLIAEGRISIVQFEFNSMAMESRAFFRDFTRILPDYRFYRLLPAGLLELEYYPLSCELFGYQNIVAAHRRFSRI